MTIELPTYREETEFDLCIISVGPNRLQVGMILRRGGWSYGGIKMLLAGEVNGIKATGLVSAHQFAAAGAVIEVQTRVYRLTIPLGDFVTSDRDLEYERELVSDTTRIIGPGYTIARRDLPAEWARGGPWCAPVEDEEIAANHCLICLSKVHSGLGAYPWTCGRGHTLYFGGGHLSAANRTLRHSVTTRS